MAGNKVSKKVTTFVENLKECWPDFEMTAYEIMNPTLDSVIKLYERFVHEIGIKADIITMLLNNELYQTKQFEDIIYVFVMYLCANHVFQILNSGFLYTLEFTFTDIINPSQNKSLVMNGSVFVNYLLYAKMTLDISILPRKEIVYEVVESLKDLKKQVNILNQNLKDSAFIQVENIDKLKNIINNKQILMNNDVDDHLELEEFDKIMQTLKPKLKLLEDENDTSTESIQTTLLKQKHLKSLIVSNPDNIVAQRNKIYQELKEEIELINENRKNLETKIDTESHLLKNNEIISNLNETLQSCEFLYMYIMSIDCKNETDRISKEIFEFQKKMKFKQNLKIKLNNKYKKLENEIQILEVKAHTLIESLHDEIALLKNECGECKKQNELSCELSKVLKYVSECVDDYEEIIKEQNIYYEKLFAKYQNAEILLHNVIASVISRMQH